MIIICGTLAANLKDIKDIRGDVSTETKTIPVIFGSKELKMVYKPYLFLARDLIQSEINAGNLTASATGEFYYENRKYTQDTYPFTTTWGTSVSSDTTYNNALRTKVKSAGIGLALALFKSHGSPRWQGTIELSGFRFTAGDLITFTSYQGGLVNQDLRIKEVQHNYTKTGWFTTLTVEEDERKVRE